MDRAALEELALKYEELCALRIEVPEDPRARMRALAARWPGALRELDELPLEVLVARRAEIAAALASDGVAPRWAELVWAFHARMRSALALKRRFGRDAAALRAFLESPGEAEQVALLITIDDAPHVLAPPEGRLSRFVMGRIADAHGLGLEACEKEAFPRLPAHVGASDPPPRGGSPSENA